MILPDVNVLIYAAMEDSPDHARFARWLEDLVNGVESYGMSDLVLSSFLRIVTNPRIFAKPATLKKASEFIEEVRGRTQCVPIQPGPRHWVIFIDLCRRARVKGNLVADAYLAALAIESGCEWITTDRDFSRFPGLRWRNPIE